MRAALLFAALCMLAGCDKLTGAADQKIADAEAIGFACRVAGKQPEVCMKENEAQPPSSILDGWKTADEDIKGGKLDPAMSNVASEKKDGEAGKEGEHKPADGDKKEEAKPAEGDKPAEGGKEGEHKMAEDKKDAKAAAEPAKHGAAEPNKAETRKAETKPGH